MASSPEKDATAEPPRWSVVADVNDHVWMRIGNDASGRGIWMRTTFPVTHAEWEQLKPSCVLADGLTQPRVFPSDVGAP
mgnify:CR=1 FL=1